MVNHFDETVSGTLCHLLSRAFSSPLEMTSEMTYGLQELIPNLPISTQDPASRLVDSWSSALQTPDELLLAYTKLFLGPFEILSLPYASIYLEPDQKLMGKVSAAVSREYAEAGLGPGSGPNEVPDHIALEWEFIYYLTNKYVITTDRKWLDRRRRFFDMHMRTWIPEFSNLIIDANVSHFYTSLAEFQFAVCDNAEKIGLGTST